MDIPFAEPASADPSPAAPVHYDAAFDAVVGHAGPTGILTAALIGGRIAHGYLFSGPNGVGKRTAATGFAKALLCTHASQRPCGTCAACRRVREGTAYDLIQVVPDGQTIKVEQVRGLTDLAAAGARRMVIVIDPADRMHVHAANALLKTLEEPPAGWILLLLSGRPDALPVTVRSRCQEVRFSPLGMADTRQVLARAGLLDEPRGLLPYLAQGAPGVILDSGLSAEEWTTEFDAVIAALHPPTVDSAARIVAAAERWGRDRATAEPFLRACQIWASAALHGWVGADDAPTDPADTHPLRITDGPDTRTPAVWAAGMDGRVLTEWPQALAQVVDRLDRNINLTTAIEGLLISLREARLPPVSRTH